MITLNINPKIILPIYRPDLSDYTHRYQVFMGGAGSGKSYYVAQKIIIKALSSKRRILIIRKYGTTIRDSVWNQFESILSDWNIYTSCKVNVSIFKIELPNCSEIIFKGMDDSEKIKSINNITDIFIEEASELSLEEVTQLDLRLRGNAEDLQMYFAYNPVSKANWTYIRYHSPEAIIPENTKIIKSTYKDNPYLSKEYIESLESLISNNRQYYNVYVLGEYCSMDKMVYSNWKVEDFDKNTIIGTNSTGLDFGYTDPTSLIFIKVDGNILYILDEYYESNVLNDKIYAAIIYKQLHKSRIIADAADPRSIAELKKLGILRIEPAKKGADSIAFGIQKISQYQIIVHPSCINTIIELENYSYKKDKQTGEYTSEPIGEYNHLMDALRYAMEPFSQPDRKLKTMSKTSFGF